MLYAVGDIHGYADQLDRAIALIEADGGAEAPVVFLGDLVDRGPDSRRVIETLIDGQKAGRDWTVILGNHDRMFLNFVQAGKAHDSAVKSGKGWLHSALGGPTTLASYLDMPGFLHPNGGGLDTLASYGLDPTPDTLMRELLSAAQQQIPQEHLDWIANLPLWHIAEDHLFVHAGLRPGIPLEEQAEDDLIWIRDGWLDDTRDHGMMVVHGHTALTYPRHEGNRINLDGGAGYGRPLIPAVYDGTNWHLLTDQGRELLWPRQTADAT